MSRRQPTDDNGSLELLLDTITNAFGGIVFLAILIVVLLQCGNPSQSEPPKGDSPDPTQLALEYQAIMEQIDKLKIQLHAVNTLEDHLSNDELKELLELLRRVKGEKQGLEDERDELMNGIADSDGDIDAAKDAESEIDDEIEDERERINELIKLLAEERERRKVKSPFPEERESSKNSYNVTIRYGRWYVDLAPDGGPNLNDFAVLGDNDKYLEVTPKPYGGVPILAKGKLSSQMLDRLQRRDANREYVSISIWDDSYTEFQLLRDYFVENDFQYRLVIVKDGDSVYYGSGDNRVQ